MANVDPVILELIARNERYVANLRSTTRVAEQSLGSQERRVQSLERQFQRSSGAIGSNLRNLAGAFAAAFSVRQLSGVVDSFTRLQNNLRVTGLEGEKLAQVQQELLRISEHYGVNIEALSQVFLKAGLAQQSLGASTEQIIELNRIVAASLRVTGASAEQSRGALIQLGQALGSDVVRAEEFNSILEGALPLAQAAARGIDRFRGDVAKLRIAVTEGEVSSREFFEGVLRGGVKTIQDAEKATLTLSGALEALGSAFTVYIGEASKANGVTAAAASAIKALADNLDVIIPALAVIATAFGVRYVAGAIAASGATRALVAHLQIATTSLAGTALAARSAGAALLAAFGGPVGLALTALTVGIGYVVTEIYSAKAATDALAASTEELRRKNDELANRLGRTRSSVDSVTDSMASLRVGMAGAITTAQGLINKLNELSTVRLAAEYGALNQELQTLERNDPIANALGLDFSADRRNTIKARMSELEYAIELQTEAIKRGIPIEEQRARAAEEATKADKAKKTRGPTAADIAARHADEISRLEQEELAARSDLATDVRDRADLEQSLLAEEYNQRSAQLAADKYFTAEQKRAQQAILDRLYGMSRSGDGEIIVGAPGLYQSRLRRNLEEELAEMDRDMLRMRGDALDAELAIADTLDDRRRIASQILSIDQRIEEQMLEEAIARGEVADAIAARADMERRHAAERVADNRRYQGALGDYLDRTNDPRARAEEAAVRELEAVRDGLAEGLSEQLGVKNDFIKSMLSIFLDDVLFRPIAEALRGGGGMGGIFSTVVGSIFGRASGGYVGAGQMVRVNEHKGGVELLRMGSQGGTVIPLGAANAQAARPQPVQVVVQVQANDYFDAKVAGISRQVATPIAQGVATQIGAAVGQAVVKGMPARMAQFQRDGT